MDEVLNARLRITIAAATAALSIGVAGPAVQSAYASKNYGGFQRSSAALKLQQQQTYCNNLLTSWLSWNTMVEYDKSVGNYQDAADDQTSADQTDQNAKNAGCSWA